MSNFLMHMEVPEGELQKIFEEIDQAQETIFQCYMRLQQLGVIVIKKEDTNDH